jgi:aminoglycoside 6'-N-acetyltransferase
VSAECDARNTASAALLHKVDFIQKRLHPRYTWIKGEWTDDLLFGILAPSASQ